MYTKVLKLLSHYYGWPTCHSCITCCTLTQQTQGTGDVWFSLRNKTYKNNSIVNLEDINSDDTALLCKTNFTDCCRRSGETALGSWIFPNGTPIQSSGKPWDFYRTRDEMVVQLHRRRGGEDGIYRCAIPDSMNVTQTIYIGVYNTSSGE